MAKTLTQVLGAGHQVSNMRQLTDAQASELGPVFYKAWLHFMERERYAEEIREQDKKVMVVAVATTENKNDQARMRHVYRMQGRTLKEARKFAKKEFKTGRNTVVIIDRYGLYYYFCSRCGRNLHTVPLSEKTDYVCDIYGKCTCGVDIQYAA